MGHPLTPDLSKLSLEELNSKYNELVKRLNVFHRWGNTGVVGQLHLLLQDYEEEIKNRQRRALEEMEKASGKFKNIIDIQ